MASCVATRLTNPLSWPVALNMQKKKSSEYQACSDFIICPSQRTTRKNYYLNSHTSEEPSGFSRRSEMPVVHVTQFDSVFQQSIIHSINYSRLLPRGAPFRFFVPPLKVGSKMGFPTHSLTHSLTYYNALCCCTLCQKFVMKWI